MRGRKRKSFDDFYTPITETGCWIWLGTSNELGYGRYYLPKNSEGKSVAVFAHRYSYELYTGILQPGLIVCHKCDIPSCVNPNHMFIGTQADNMNDMVNKGRHRNSLKTHCKRGHSLTDETMYKVKASPNARGVCKKCMNMHAKKYREKLCDKNEAF